MTTWEGQLASEGFGHAFLRRLTDPLKVGLSVITHPKVERVYSFANKENTVMTTENNSQDGTQSGNEGGEGESHVAGEGTPTAAEIASLKEKAAKAEKLEQELGSTKRDFKKLSKQLEEVKNSLNPQDTSEQTAQQSNEPDYAKVALLNSVDIKHPDDQKAVLDEAARLKLPITDVLQMEHIKSKLEKNANVRAAQDGMPEGSGRKGGTNKGDIQYYLDNPDAQVPSDDVDFANKIIDARVNRHVNSSKFSDELYSG